MSHVVVKRAFEELIDSWAAVGQVGTGFTFTEGPVWHPVEHYLLFSDMPADVRRRWDQRGGVREVKRPSNKCNGMTYDEDLNLIVCEHATSSLVRERPDGRPRGDRLALRGLRAEQPQRRGGEVRRLDLLLRSLVRPHAGVRRGAAAAARLPGRLPRAARRRRARADGRPPYVRPTQRPVLLPRRAAALRQRHGAGADPRVRPEHVRVAHEWAGVRQRHRVGARARPAGRHEMRLARQRLVHRAGRRVGVCALRRADRQGAGARAGRQPRLGRPDFQHALHVRHALGLLGQDQGGAAAGALHATRARPAARRAAPATRRRARPPLRRRPRRRNSRRHRPHSSRSTGSTLAAAPSSSRTCRTTW